MHVCHVAVCVRYPIAGEVPRASVEAPWTPASLVPGSNPAARAARSGSSGAAARAKASNGWGGNLPSGVGGGGAHCCRRLGTFFLLMTVKGVVAAQWGKKKIDKANVKK